MIAHNKTLAAQLCNEFRTYFPRQRGRVLRLLLRLLPARGLRPEQGPLHREGLGDQPGDRPAAPRRDGGAVRAPRRDRSSPRVSCIYGLGSPETYDENLQTLQQGRVHRPRRAAAQARLDPVHAQRHGARRAARSACAARRSRSSRPTPRRPSASSLFGDEVERLQHFDPLTGELLEDDLEHVGDLAGDRTTTSSEGTIEDAVAEIGARAERALRRARGARASCSSPTACASARSTTWRCCARWASARASRTTRGSSTAASRATGPYCLIDYFPDDFVCFIDESHQTVPQIGGMYEGDRSRKQTLVDYGFRLPSALDNRPQTFEEFLSITPQMVFVSATPGEYERTHSPADRRADRAPDRDRRPATSRCARRATRSTT